MLKKINSTVIVTALLKKLLTTFLAYMCDGGMFRSAWLTEITRMAPV